MATLSNIDVNQFYGIEIFEFPTRIAEVALWMMDHIMNNKLSLAFGDYYARIPLKASPHIHNADALEIEWRTVLPAEAVFIRFRQSAVCRGKISEPSCNGHRCDGSLGLGGTGGTLDYVTAWFLKGGRVRPTKARPGSASLRQIRSRKANR